jgi:hypothetical protein
MRSVPQREFVYGCAMGLLALFLDGCAASRGYDGAVRLGNGINFYQLYDNSRDWGPSYLVGPPYHHFGDEVRIDDSRSAHAGDPGAGGSCAAGDNAGPAAAAGMTDRRCGSDH